MLENIRKRDRKSVVMLSTATILSLICCITLIVVAAHKPGSPEFCARCHSMESSYNTWKETVSCNTSCLSCHTHDNSGRTLSVEIRDSNCTSAECHPVEKLTSQISKFKEVFSFDHKSHLKEYPTNLRLRCTGCHSYSGAGAGTHNGAEAKHFDIDENVCFICHFIKRDVPLLTADKQFAVDDCSLCHRDVQVKVMIYGKEFDHIKYERKLKVECTNCHFETVHMSADGEKNSCYYCHTKIPPDYEGVDRMHNDHVEMHKVPCSPCHNRVLHKWSDEYMDNILPTRYNVENAGSLPAVSNTAENAKSDDRYTHMQINEITVFDDEPYLLQKKIYAGYGGRGVEGGSDPMYLATVNCSACHKGRDFRVDPMICNICHEKGFDKTMKEQKGFITGLLKTLEDLLVVAQMGGISDSVIDEARHNYELVVNDGSVGVHNIKYVKDLMNHSIESLKEVVRRSREDNDS